ARPAPGVSHQRGGCFGPNGAPPISKNGRRPTIGSSLRNRSRQRQTQSRNRRNRSPCSHTHDIRHNHGIPRHPPKARPPPATTTTPTPPATTMASPAAAAARHLREAAGAVFPVEEVEC